MTETEITRRQAVTAVTNAVKRDLKHRLYPALGGQSRAAQDTTVGQQCLSDNANLAKPDSQITVKTLYELLSAYQLEHGSLTSPVPVLTPLLQPLGLDVVHLPDPSRPVSWMHSIGDISKETGDVISAITKALEDDNDVDGGEILTLDLIKEVNDLQSCISGLQATLLRKVAPREEQISRN